MQEDLPPAAYKLEGIKDLPSSSCTYYIKCPICKTFYEYHYDAHCMEYDIYITRVLPQKALEEKLISKKWYDEVIENLPKELDADDEIASRLISQRKFTMFTRCVDDKVSYAARALADHYLKEKKHKQVIELLGHAKNDARCQTCSAISVANEDEGLNIDPYIDTLISLLYDKGKHVADRAAYIFHTYSDKPCENIEKYWDKLMNAFSKNDAKYHSITLLKKVVKNKNLKKLDMSPAIYRLIKFFTVKGAYNYLYDDARAVLTAYVKHSGKNAKHFLEEFKKFKSEKFVSSLNNVEKEAGMWDNHRRNGLAKTKIKK